MLSAAAHLRSIARTISVGEWQLSKQLAGYSSDSDRGPGRLRTSSQTILESRLHQSAKVTTHDRGKFPGVIHFTAFYC
jgi:hypothetical protein